MRTKKYSWIDTLYQQSWEMELLISGFVLVLLFQTYGQISYLENWVLFNIRHTVLSNVFRIFTTFFLPLASITCSLFDYGNFIFDYWFL